MMTMQASLKKELEGYCTIVEKDVYVSDAKTGKIIFKQKTITKKECPPDLSSIKMLLEKGSSLQPPRKEEPEGKGNRTAERTKPCGTTAAKENARLKPVEPGGEKSTGYRPYPERMKKEYANLIRRNTRRRKGRVRKAVAGEKTAR